MERPVSGEAELLDRITVRADVFGGKPIIRDMRIALEHVLGMLAAGDTAETILREYPELEPATVEDFLDWFPGVEAWQVKAVLEHEVKHLDSRVEHANPL